MFLVNLCFDSACATLSALGGQSGIYPLGFVFSLCVLVMLFPFSILKTLLA